jgi:hypothetical protein
VEVVTDYFWGEVGLETTSPVLKLSRQCPLVLPVEEQHFVGINLLRR